MDLNGGQRYHVRDVQAILGIGKSRCARQRGSAEQARDYCQKAETRVEGPWTHGDFAVEQGRRTDLERIAQLPLVQVALEHPVTYLQYHRGLTARRDLVHRVPETEPWRVERGRPPEGTPCYYIRWERKQVDQFNIEYIFDWNGYDYETIACCDRAVDWVPWVKSPYRGLIVNKVRVLYLV